MITVEHYQQSDFSAIKEFVESIQEYERLKVPELKPGTEIGQSYAEYLIRAIADRRGIILVARMNRITVGFVCAWVDLDEDQLLREDFRVHAYISDLFVLEEWRRRGIARELLRSVESEMRDRGCQRIRICTKATNQTALDCYLANGYSAYEIVLSKRLAE